MSQYNIAGFTMELDLPEWMIEEKLQRFSGRAGQPTLTLQSVCAPMPELPTDVTPLVRMPGRSVYTAQGSTLFYHTPDDSVSYMEIDAAYSHCLLNIEPAYNHPEDLDSRVAVSDALFANLRTIMMGKLALKNGLLTHAAVIKRQGKGILFSAVSGTGKSTHAHLWQELYPDVEILNGDNGIYRILDGVVRVYGGPWCGSSEEYLADDAPVAAIVFLEQAPENSIVRLDLPEAVMRLSARCFLPFWDPALIEKSMSSVEYIAARVPCWLLRCRPEPAAVKLVQECLER